MKKFFAIIAALLVGAAAIMLTSCSDTPDTDDGKISIVTTIFPPYDFARQIVAGAQDDFALTMLMPPGSESHDFEASLSDIAKIGEADLIICVGGETDEWIDAAIDASESEAAVLRLTDMVTLYEEDTSGIFEDSREHDHENGHTHEHNEECEDGHKPEHGEYDEHVWTSPANAAVISEEICGVLCELSPENTSLLEANTSSYASALRKLDGELQSLAENARRDTLIFADRFPFRYLTESMGVKYYAAFSGCSSDSEPSLATIYNLAKKVEETGAPVVFTIEFSNGSSANVISDETGAAVRTLHSCHNVSKEDFDAGVTYLDLMRRNLEVINEALN